MGTFMNFVWKVLVSTIITLIASITKRKVLYRIGAY